MRICLMIEGQEGVSWAQWVDLARAAELYGFEALYRSDHYLSLFEPNGVHRSMPGRRSRPRAAHVAPSVRDPGVAAVLSSPLSPGQGRRHHRPHLGGESRGGNRSGWYETEHLSFGFAFLRPTALPGLRRVRADRPRTLERRGQLHVQRRHYQLVEASALPKPVQRPHPPLVMGGKAGPRAAALAARWASEYNFYDTSPDQVGEKRRRLRAACDAAGGTPTLLNLDQRQHPDRNRSNKTWRPGLPAISPTRPSRYPHRAPRQPWLRAAGRNPRGHPGADRRLRLRRGHANDDAGVSPRRPRRHRADRYRGPACRRGYLREERGIP